MKHNFMSTMVVGFLFIAFISILIFYPSLVPASASKPIIYSKNFSYGFQDNEKVYFLLEYRVWQHRRPLWFILPIERSPRIYYQKIFLYCFDITTDQLEKLATIREEFPPHINIKYIKFTKTQDNKIVFAYRVGWEKKLALYDMHIWDPVSESLVATEHKKNMPESSPQYEKYWGDYQSPWEDNPGILTITKLKTILENVRLDDWALPREW